jgi:hypothetical protein
MVDEVIAHIAERCLLLVHGSSGSGKSSLIRAGVLPRLEWQHRRSEFGWSTAAMRPAGGPLWNLAEALATRGGREEDARQVDALRSRFDEKATSLGGIVSGLLGSTERRLCLLVDQFEEVFQYAAERSLEEATLFVGLIATTLDDGTASPLRVILTMRSDFLGECARWPNLALAVNRAQYLLPPMGLLALTYAISRPAELYQGTVDRGLIERIIADAQGERDQLPLIQHALMRLWDLTPPAENGSRRLDLAIYQDCGPLARLLDDHADQVARTAEPGNGELPLVSGIFRALSDLNPAGQPIRRQQTLRELAAVTRTPEDRVRSVVDAFRADGVSFLKPYGREELGEGEPIDIAHEALMRCWQRLADVGSGWLWDEFRQGLAWKSLLAQADLFLKDSRNVLSPPTAEDRRQWLSSRSAAWAACYGGGWDKVDKLMAASRAYAHRLRRKIQWLGFSLAALALIVAGGLLLGIKVTHDATQARYNAKEAQGKAAQARDEANQALDKLYAAQAEVAWDDFASQSSGDILSARQQNAQWQIASGEPPLRQRFVDLLWEDPDLPARFAAKAPVISRALGLMWAQTPTEQKAVLDPLHVAIGKTTDPLSLLLLEEAVAMLDLSEQQARDVRSKVLDKIIRESIDPPLGSLGQAAAALAPRLTADEAQAALARVLKAIGETTDRAQLGALGPAAAALASRLTVEQVPPAFARVLRAMGETDPDRVGALGQAGAALAPRLTSKRVELALTWVLKAVYETYSPVTLGSLGQAAAALGATAEQAEPALHRLVFVIGETRDPSTLGSLEKAAAALALKLTEELASRAFDWVIYHVRETTNPDQLAPLGQTAAAVAPRLTADEAQAALARVLEAIGETAHSRSGRSAGTGGCGAGPAADAETGPAGARSGPRGGRRNDRPRHARIARTGGGGAWRNGRAGAARA